MDQCPGNGHTLFLSAGEVAALLAHDGVQAIGHEGQIVCQGVVSQGFFHLPVSKRPAQGDVVPDGGIEQEYVLPNNCRSLVRAEI